METAIQFLSMGGYGVFVWPAFIIVAIVMTALFIWSWQDLRRERQTLKSLAKRGKSTVAPGATDDA
jgi:heme exporter protein CcmD